MWSNEQKVTSSKNGVCKGDSGRRLYDTMRMERGLTIKSIETLR